MGLGNQFARSVIIEKYSNKDPFWDPVGGTPSYSDLNRVSIPSNGEIRSYQIKKIEEFSNKGLENKFSAMDGLATENFLNIINTFESDETKVINGMIENFVTKMNSLYYVNKSETKSLSDWNAINQRLSGLEKALSMLINQLQASSPILEATLQEIQTALQACQMNSLNANVVNNFLLKINQIKGSTLEELGVAYFRSLRIPAIDSLRLGSVYLNTDGRDGRHKGQLIQDLLAYSVTSSDIINDLEVSYKPIGSNQYIKAPLSQLFRDIEKANGQSKQIVINDETYDVLLRLQSINIQAKSGKNQKPWNINKSTQVSISEYDPVDELSLSAYHTFNLLQSLVNEEDKSNMWSMKETSEEYNAIANYGLATVMYKILHLSEHGNQYLLTPYGFMTYQARVKQLLEAENHIALIQKNVIVDNNTMNRKYSVTIGE